MGIRSDKPNFRSDGLSPSFEFGHRLSPKARLARRLLAVLPLVLLGAMLVSTARANVMETSQLSEQDNALLDEVQQRAVLYFIEHSDAETGLVRDRAPNDGSEGHSPSSIAATGFALTAWCIADAKGWMPKGEALKLVRTALFSAATEVENERGWFYHFVDMRTGKRVWECEASTIDTALFLQGAIQAREYLRDPAVTYLVNRIYARIDWQWALNHGKTLSHGWRPERGFIRYRWDSYSELMGMYLLGIGAPESPLAPDTWDAWSRGPRAQFAGRTFLQGGPLFTHQYAQAWFDFRGLRDNYADYYQNSVDATLAQRAWFAKESVRFAHLSQDVWGLTASDSAKGYRAWGTPGHDTERSDGTLVPCAPGGSLPFAPRECLTALARMREIGGEGVWGRYGFADAFNPKTGWASPDVIGIDVGITLIMAENLRSGFVWETFMRAPEVQRGMRLAGFRNNDQNDKPPGGTLATVAAQ